MRLLILTASAGNGHISAAKAIEVAASNRGWEAESLDVLTITSKAFRSWFEGGYETLVRKSPAVWGHLYRTSDRKRFNYAVQTLLDTTCCRALDGLITERRADAIVCTHSLPQPRLDVIRKKIPLWYAVCVTDIHPHLMWLRGRPDHFFVPTAESARVLERRLPSAAGRIDVTGIPVHAAFQPKSDAVRPHILLTSGGIGAGPIIEAAEALASLPAKLTVICGRNPALRENLTQLLPNAEVLGHIPIEEMAAKLQAASLLVGKPGGLTTFEALACGAPFLIYWPLLIPGQEEDNARFLVESGAGSVARNLVELTDLAGRIVGDGTVRSGMADAARSLGKPGAADAILDRLSELCPILVGEHERISLK